MAEQPVYPDRIDFIETPEGEIQRQCFRHEHKGRDVPMGLPKTLQEGYTLRQALDWCLENGYRVYDWKHRSPFGGHVARAFLGTPWPIRSTRRMFEMRDELDRLTRAAIRSNRGKWHPEETLARQDLAYCL